MKGERSEAETVGKLEMAITSGEAGPPRKAVPCHGRRRRMPVRKPQTIGASLFWSYANLAMMTAVLNDRVDRPARKHYSIRARLYKGLCNGTMSVRDYFDDEKLKLSLPRGCAYCGSTEQLSVDHIIPQERSGRHGGENLVHCCRRCNSSKGSKDLLAWMTQQDRFPPLWLLKRYLKMAVEHCQRHGLMDLPLVSTSDIKGSLPFALDLLPNNRFPAAAELCLWIGETHGCSKDA